MDLYKLYDCTEKEVQERYDKTNKYLLSAASKEVNNTQGRNFHKERKAQFDYYIKEGYLVKCDTTIKFNPKMKKAVLSLYKYLDNIGEIQRKSSIHVYYADDAIN